MIRSARIVRIKEYQKSLGIEIIEPVRLLSFCHNTGIREASVLRVKILKNSVTIVTVNICLRS